MRWLLSAIAWGQLNFAPTKSSSSHLEVPANAGWPAQWPYNGWLVGWLVDLKTIKRFKYVIKTFIICQCQMMQLPAYCIPIFYHAAFPVYFSKRSKLCKIGAYQQILFRVTFIATIFFIIKTCEMFLKRYKRESVARITKAKTSLHLIPNSQMFCVTQPWNSAAGIQSLRQTSTWICHMCLVTTL